jgi:hypothetical protein
MPLRSFLSSASAREVRGDHGREHTRCFRVRRVLPTVRELAKFALGLALASLLGIALVHLAQCSLLVVRRALEDEM